MEINEILKALNFSNIFWQVTTPLIFCLIDIVTGFIQALINKNVSSQKMRVGLLHKALLFILIIMGFIIGITFNLNYISKVICIYIIIMEGISILENFGKAGIQLKKLKEFFNIKEGKK